MRFFCFFRTNGRTTGKKNEGPMDPSERFKEENIRCETATKNGARGIVFFLCSIFLSLLSYSYLVCKIWKGALSPFFCTPSDIPISELVYRLPSFPQKAKFHCLYFNPTLLVKEKNKEDLVPYVAWAPFVGGGSEVNVAAYIHTIRRLG